MHYNWLKILMNINAKTRKFHLLLIKQSWKFSINFEYISSFGILFAIYVTS